LEEIGRITLGQTGKVFVLDSKGNRLGLSGDQVTRVEPDGQQASVEQIIKKAGALDAGQVGVFKQA
jgi:hypothetical protein